MSARTLLAAILGLAALAAPGRSSSLVLPPDQPTHAAILTPADPTTEDMLFLDTYAQVPDTGHKLKTYTVEVDEPQRRIEVDVAYRRLNGGLLVFSEIQQRIAIAPLAAGDWTVRVRFRMDGKTFFKHTLPVVVAAG